MAQILQGVQRNIIQKFFPCERVHFFIFPFNEKDPQFFTAMLSKVDVHPCIKLIYISLYIITNQKRLVCHRLKLCQSEIGIVRQPFYRPALCLKLFLKFVGQSTLARTPLCGNCPPAVSFFSVTKVPQSLYFLLSSYKGNRFRRVLEALAIGKTSFLMSAIHKCLISSLVRLLQQPLQNHLHRIMLILGIENGHNAIVIVKSFELLRSFFGILAGKNGKVLCPLSTRPTNLLQQIQSTIFGKTAAQKQHDRIAEPVQ